LNILVVMNDPKDFKTVEPFLTAGDLKTTYASTLTEAIGKIQTTPFQIVMMSWNLHMVDVVKTFEFLDEKLGSMVVVFSESDKPTIVKQLVASRINRTIFPPISGPGVIKRLQQLMRTKAADGAAKDNKDLGIVAVTGVDVPQDITWEASQANGPSPSGEKVWQGVSAKDDTQTYVYQGKEPPKWDPAKKAWDPSTNMYLKISNEARASMGSVFGQPIKRKPKTTVLGVEKDANKKYSMPTTHENDGSALFYASLSAALEIVNSVFCDPNEVQDEGHQVTLSWVQAGKMTGMVLVGDPADTAESIELLKSLQGEVKLEAEKKKEKYEILVDKAVVPIAPTNIAKWAGRQTKYVYGVKSPNTKMVMAYVPVERKIEMALDESGQYYAISVPDALRTGVKVPCDFFVFMKKNQRFVRYINKDSVINDATIAKLNQGQITTVMFHKNDLDTFLSYKSKYYLGITK
jgi:hypothetical protein